MASTVEERTYEEALNWFRDHGFDLLEAPGTQARVFLKKYNVSAAIQKNGDDHVKIFRLSRLSDRQRNFEAGEQGIPAVPQNRKDRSSSYRGPSQSSATIHRRIKRRPGPAHAVQRIARHRERVVPLRPRRKSRQASCGSAETSLGKGWGNGSGREKGPRITLNLITSQPKL